MWLNELASPDSYTGFSTSVVSTLSPRDARALGRRLASHSPLRPRPTTARQQSPGRCLCFKAPEVSGAWQRGAVCARENSVGTRASPTLPPRPADSPSTDDNWNEFLLESSRAASPEPASPPTCKPVRDEVTSALALSTASVVNWVC